MSGTNDPTDDDEDEVDRKRIKREESVVIYGWEEELEEYDEPDVYPSEKDYKWFEEWVTDSEEEAEEEPKEEPPEQPDDTAAAAATAADGAPKEEEKTAVDSTAASEAVEPQEGEQQQQQQQQRQTEADAKSDKGGEGEEGGEEEEEFLQAIVLDGDEHEEDNMPRKKYKPIQVKRLVERPPKIYHVVDEIRVPDASNPPDEFPQKPFHFIHSFAYDCQQLGNLIVLDDCTLMFMSGFTLTFYNHRTFERTYMRTLGGGSFGSIALHPSRKLFAAAEKGVKPLIGIWSWPKLQLFRMLEEGTERVYASVNFSPDGNLLASQGGEPDYLITVWNWLAQAPILRVKSHVQDVFRVTFAKELAGLLTTSGLCHIKFWKMAGTFTGLKLKGDVGRFGRTELSDIEGYVEMPDGKVLSGTEWGNLLVWENGLVIAELCMVNSAPCHSGIVRQILMVEGDFFTTGQDGRIKVWRYEDVDTAEIHTTMESLKVAVKTVTNVTVNEEGDIWSIFQDPYNNDDVSVFWFAQDGTGLIWLVDLSFLNIAKEPKVVLTAHGGPILGSAISPAGHMIATIGHHGKIIIHDYVKKNLLAVRVFTGSGSCILWPHHGDNYEGCMLIVGYEDGVIRVLVLSGKPSTDGFPLSICLQKAYKPHRSKVTSIALDSDGEFLVTGGNDGTVFFFHASKSFTPLCYVEMPFLNEVHKVFWSSSSHDSKTVMVICKGAMIQEVEMPNLEEIDNTTSYCFKNVKLLRNCQVKSIKSVLRHNEELNKKQEVEEAKQAAIERENQRLLDEGIETQEEQDARLLEEALELEKGRTVEPKKDWKPHIPLIPNNILVAYQDYLDSDVVHVTLDDFDAGYVYSVRLMSDDAKRVVGKESEEPFNAVPIIECDDVPVSKLVFTNHGKTVIIGFKDGRVRLSPLEYEYDLESMGTHWTMGAHDTDRGDITSISVNNAITRMFTTGMDGNFFMYSLVDDETSRSFTRRASVAVNPVFNDAPDIRDIITPDAYTLEDSKNVEKERAILAAAKKNKTAKREKIAFLRFRFADILSKNNDMPAEMRLTPVELSVASDNAMRSQERYDQALGLLKEEMAWQCEYERLGLDKLRSFYVDRLEYQLFTIKAFDSDNKLSSFRLSKYPDFFEEAKVNALKDSDSKQSFMEHVEEDRHIEQEEKVCEEPRPKRVKGMNKFAHQRMVRLWQKRQKRVRRQKDWELFLKTDPSEKEMDDDNTHINEARSKMGDMKLKIDPNYKVPESRRLTVRSARNNQIALEEKMFNYQKQFNDELISLRNMKVKVISRLKEYSEKIAVYQAHIPEANRIPIPPVPVLTMEENPNALLSYTADDIARFKQKQQAMNATMGVQLIGPGKKGEVKRRRKSWNAMRLEIEAIEKPPYSDVISDVPTPMELQTKHIKQVQAEFYQKHYLDCMNKERFQFDSILKLLKHKKLKLDYDLKIAEARMINLTEEFILARKSVSLEANLEQIVKECTKEKRTCTTTMKTLQKGIDSYKSQLDSIAAKRNAMMKEVLEIATNAPSYEKYLIRVFRKKITAAKQKNADDENAEDDASDDSDDSDESEDMAMDEDDEDEDDLDVDLPPQDLKTWIYEAVVEVRGRRLGLDEAEIKNRTSMDELVTQLNGFKHRINMAENTLRRTKQELDKFNLEKQFKLNSNEGEVSLCMHQLHYMSANLDESLVINRSDIKKLRDRIPELQKEKRDEKKRVLTTKNEYHRLYRDDKKFKQKLEDFDNKCDSEMLSKFGRVKPVEELEQFCEDPDITRMKREIEDTEVMYQATERNIMREYREVMMEKTHLARIQIEKYSDLLDLNRSLANINQAMESGLSVLPQKVDEDYNAEELARMKAVVTHQRATIDYLQQQILALSGQSIKPLPPITPRK